MSPLARIGHRSWPARRCLPCCPDRRTMAGLALTRTASGRGRIGAWWRSPSSTRRPTIHAWQPLPSASWTGSAPASDGPVERSTGSRGRMQASTATRSAPVPGSGSPTTHARNAWPRRSSPGNGQTVAGTAAPRPAATAHRSTSRTALRGACTSTPKQLVTNKPARLLAGRPSCFSSIGSFDAPVPESRSSPMLTFTALRVLKAAGR